MADGTHIEWTEATWNPITGCSVTSPGCTNCYAMKLAGTRLAHHESRAGLTQDSKAGPVWTGEVRLNEQWLDQPLRWTKPRMIFVCAHGDLFHEGVPDEWIDRVFAIMALCPQHTFQVLTKRSARMREYFRETTGWRVRIADLLNELKPSPLWNGNVHQGWQNLHGRPDGLPNVWLGVSVEDQQRADERIPDLLATPAAVRWISAEPLLGPVDLTALRYGEVVGNVPSYQDALTARIWQPEGTFDRPLDPRATREGRTYVDLCCGLDWVVAGGESGPGARPMHPDWARSLRDQCAAADVAFFFKQWGEWRETDGPETHTCNRSMRSGTHWLKRDGTLHPRSANFSIYHEYRVAKLGKKRAGRLLDGVEHNGMPGRSPPSGSVTVTIHSASPVAGLVEGGTV